MEKELDQELIKTTQSTLGKYVKRPPLSEKLLKKPPFRFLHDIITTVLKTTGFFAGLFDDEELNSDNVKDRESKIAFLNKVIVVINASTGKNLSVKPAKIVAGQEPEKTNELLQCLALALEKKLSSDEAVRIYNDKNKVSQPQKKVTKVPSSTAVKKSTDVKKTSTPSSDKIVTKKRDGSDRSLTRNEKNRVNVSKQNENTAIKKRSQPKSTNLKITNHSSIDQLSSRPKEKDIKRSFKNDQPSTEVEIAAVSNIVTNDENNQGSKVRLDSKDGDKLPEFSPENEQFDSSYVIAGNVLNSSSSQELLQGAYDKEKGSAYPSYEEQIISDIERSKTHIYQEESQSPLLQPEDKFKTSSSAAIGTNHESQNITNASSNNEKHNSHIENKHLSRPPSVRPSSSRPGAPRLRDKNDNITPADNNTLVGKVNIIVENTTEEEEDSIIIVDQPTDSATIQKDEATHLLLSNQHGHLVQQILDSQKELSQITGKTEIEWQFGAQKAREAVNQEIEQLRFNIQALSRVANPLGKVLDHIQEDVEVMRQELQQWQTSYEDASKELLKQKLVNEESLLPYHTKLKQLDAEIYEKRDKINDLKIVINKNSTRIEKLLAAETVQ